MDFRPADNYEHLLRQARALHGIASAQEARLSRASERIAELTRTISLMDGAAVDAERAINAQLTDALLAAEERISELEKSNAGGGW